MLKGLKFSIILIIFALTPGGSFYALAGRRVGPRAVDPNRVPTTVASVSDKIVRDEVIVGGDRMVGRLIEKVAFFDIDQLPISTDFSVRERRALLLEHVFSRLPHVSKDYSTWMSKRIEMIFEKRPVSVFVGVKGTKYAVMVDQGGLIWRGNKGITKLNFGGEFRWSKFKPVVRIEKCLGAMAL